ncbi:MAG: SDR family NAD(P)-dependent oxidoreductase [Acetobacteraceae bacterium]
MSEQQPEGRREVAGRFSLEGKRALVTGGSLSMGRAIALGLAAAGAAVAIQYSSDADATFGRREGASETLAALQAYGPAVGIAADFRTSAAARGIVADAEKALGPLDVLVIAASVQQRVDFFAVTEEEIAREVAVNFTATIALLQAALPGMMARGYGRILAIGSINQTRPDPDLAVYAALKAAQHNLILALARRFAPTGVTLNTLSPGLIATERNRWRRADAADWAEIQRAANPVGRAGVPDEVVGAALLLCSDTARFITGSDLQVTGGGHL